MGISENAQRISAPFRASPPSSNAISKTSVWLQSHFIFQSCSLEEKILTRHWRTKSTLAHAGEGCRPLKGIEHFWQYATQVNKGTVTLVCLDTTVLQVCFPELLYCLINGRGVIWTTAVKTTQAGVPKDKEYKSFTESLTATHTQNPSF